ncbi:hypothetical protein QQ045_000694 [Rhodiola kirilowii]
MSDADSDKTLYNALFLTLFLIAPPTFISLCFLQAPYGKHHSSGWGPSLLASLAWFLMESPTLWLILYLFPRGRHAVHLKSLILISPHLLHYFNRTILYPLRQHSIALSDLSRFHSFWFQLLERLFGSQIAFELQGL